MKIKSDLAAVLLMVAVFIMLPSSSSSSSGRSSPSQPLSEEVSRLITDWAPLIWLHSEEIFFPSSVDYFLFNTEVRDVNETVIQSLVDRYNIPTGPETTDYHLNTIPDLPCLDCFLGWFVGQNVSEVDVPTQVFVREYKDECGTVDVAYRFFYPYNYGKDVCVGVSIGGVCEGVMQSFGNHVGDWEHYSIRIRDGKVTDCYVAVHSFGAYYSWNDTTHNFQFVRGEEGRGLVDVTYPQTVEVLEGTTHAELFSANGSHGLWSQLGTHEYVHFPIHLRDETERGAAWETWRLMETVTWEDDMELGSEYNYLDYRGGWGNLGGGCGIIQEVSGECILNSGPTLWPPSPSDFSSPSPANDCH